MLFDSFRPVVAARQIAQRRNAAQEASTIHGFDPANLDQFGTAVHRFL